MGPWLVLVSPCFRENVVATCKIWSFLCSLDNLLQKNVIVLFFGNLISKWRSFEKRLFLTYFSHFLVTRENYKNSFSTYLTHIHTRILLTLLTFFAIPILYSSDHPISIKFCQLVVNIVIKELQMVFLTSTVINSNGIMKELERKIKCEKLMFR